MTIITVMIMMMVMVMVMKIIRLPALGGGDHRVLHAGKQQVRARHSFAWVPCAQVLVLVTWYLVLGTGYPAHKLVRIGKRQEEMKGGGGWILASATTTTTITAGEADTCGGFQLTVTAE